MKKTLLLFFALLSFINIEAQVPPGLSSILECEANFDGFAVFDLTVWNQIGDNDMNDLGPISYYITETDAIAQVNPIANPSAYTNIANPQLLYYSANLISDGTLVVGENYIEVLAKPTANQPNDLEVCDDNVSDGIVTLDLHQLDAQIIGAQDPASFVVNYYATQADADSEVNALVSPYTNVSNPQTIYANVADVTTDCLSDAVSFNLTVNTLNINPAAFDAFTCGDGQGYGLFDLTVYESQILMGNTNLSVSYYETLQDAASDTNAIVDPYYYLNSTPYYQDVYIRVDDNNTGCFYTSSNFLLYLNVQDFQVTQPTPLVVADDDGDGFAEFNLTDKDAEISGGIAGYMVTYHETQPDAANGVNALSSPYTNVVANTQTVYARVQDANGNCSNFTDLQLIAEFVPFQVNQASLETCNDTGNVVFDLTSANQDILGGLNSNAYSIAYYYVYDDALTQTNAITNATTYSYDPNFTTIFAGVTENATGEYVITTIDFIVNDIPTLDFAGNLSICSGTSIVLDPNTNEPNFIYQWNTGENTPTITTSIGGFYEVTIINPATGCTNMGSVTVTEEQSTTAGTPQDLASCDPNSVFDLTTTITEIANGADPSTLTITFHETQQDASTGSNPIQNPNVYTASSSLQTIYVAVYNANQTACGAFVSFNLISENCPVSVDCAQPITESFCYTNNETAQYTYTSIDGSPLQITINSGQVEHIYDELIVLDSDGTTNLNAATPYGNSGDVSNLTFVASGDTITIYVDSDGSINCQGNNYASIDYLVSCFDTTAVPTCNAVLTTPQDQEIDVNENTDLSWSAGSGLITGYILNVVAADGNILVDMLDVGNVTTYDVGTLDFATQYFVTITPYNANGSATNCVDASFTTRANPNVIIDCSTQQPANTVFCYTNNETQQYNFASNDGSPLVIVFNSGMTENVFDELIVLDSDGTTNLNVDNPYGNAGDLSGLTFTTTGDTATVYIQSDGSVISCTNNPIDFDVFCGSNIGFIEVNAFLDLDNDGIFNNNDTPFNNGVFTYEVNDDTIINTVNSTTGSFTINNQDEANSYDFTFAANPGYENCYSIPTALIENVTVLNGSTEVVNFPITELMQCEDVAVYLVPSIPPRPGFLYWNNVVIENLGSSVIANGTVEFVHDPLVTFVEVWNPPATGTITLTATGFTYDFVNLQPGEVITMYADMQVDAATALGTFLTNTVTYTTDANDVVANNNTASVTQEVIGSYDPNDIMESYGPEIVYDDFVTTDEYLYYTIRFQNVGTAEAINVRIENTIDPLLDVSTMQMLRSSHDNVMMLTGNQTTWTFDNINLPAESQDERGSNGFVQYKIKPTAGYALGTVIPNTAEIYFDFNAAVVTNTFTTTFVQPSLSVEEFNLNAFTLYPNPANNNVTVKFNNALSGNTSIDIIDVQGKKILSRTAQNTMEELELNVSNLQAGIYFVKLKNNDKQTIKKLIIE